MNIFYYSVHQILEDDEIRLFQSQGHNVFCFGINRKNGALQNFRPHLTFNATENYMFDHYEQTGGTFNTSDEDEKVLPSAFDGHFSVFIIMHDIGFIARFWHRLKHRHVIWRTIGQGVDSFEDFARPMRNEGLKIVRYSPVERSIPGSMGEDAIIRFYKRPDQYGGWTGDDLSVLTFSNSFEQRYPLEAAAYREITKEVPSSLGGYHNETFDNAIGFAEADKQNELYRKFRVYLYISGMDIPYTLNFIEAWMTGIPVVVYAPLERTGRYFEIDKLIVDGVNGFVCRDLVAAKLRCSQLIADRSLAQKIGASGRDAAIAYFGIDTVSRQWNEVLKKISL